MRVDLCSFFVFPLFFQGCNALRSGRGAVRPYSAVNVNTTHGEIYQYICVLVCMRVDVSSFFFVFLIFFRVAMHYAVTAAPSGLTLL